MSDLDRDAAKASNILLGIFICYFILQTLLVAASPDVTGLVRIILTLLLMYFVMMGHRWAKWIMVVLFYLATAISLWFSYSFLERSVWLSVAFLVAGIVMSCVATFLIASKPLNRYFAWKRSTPAL